MYAEITFKNPVLQRLNEILDHLEMNFEMNYIHNNDFQSMSSEEAVQAIASELQDDADVALLGEILGMEVGE